MNKSIITLFLTVLILGCSTTPEDRQRECEYARTAEAAYNAGIAAGHVPSQEEIIAIAIVRAIIVAQCGPVVTPLRFAEEPKPFDPASTDFQKAYNRLLDQI